MWLEFALLVVLLLLPAIGCQVRQMALVDLFALPAVEISGPAYGAGGLVLHREAGLVLPKRAGKVKLNKYFGTRT
jgi:hypothetical protein